jgi:KEOPS complex subunit Pcc1
VHDATLSFAYDSTERARRVERSVRPEVGEIEGERTVATLSRDGRTVEVAVEATDLVALRAGCNTWLSLVTVAERLAGC